MSDYVVQEMARTRIDEPRTEAALAGAAEKARRSREYGRYSGLLGGLWIRRAEVGGFSRGTIEQACCA